MPHPTVSIITPLYNSSLYIEEALDSVCNQTYDNWECLLIDDGSIDATPETVSPYLRDSRFSYIRQPNQGIAAARNTGIGAARGTWIAFLDHDDKWFAPKLEDQLAFARLHGCDIVCSDALITDGRAQRFCLYSDWFPPNMRASVRRCLDKQLDLFGLLISRNFLCTSSVLVRKSIFEQFGLLDVSATPADDYEMWLRCMPSVRIGYISEPLTEYRWHPAAFSRNIIMRVKIIDVLFRTMARCADDEERRRRCEDHLALQYDQLLGELIRKRQLRLAATQVASLPTKGKPGISIGLKILRLAAKRLVG